jgi:hypothetical protein
MSITKEKILRTVELMDDDDAAAVLDWLNSNFVVVYRKKEWDDIEEVFPDEIDLIMMEDIETNPNCKEFISKEEMTARRMSRKPAK